MADIDVVSGMASEDALASISFPSENLVGDDALLTVRLGSVNDTIQGRDQVVYLCVT